MAINNIDVGTAADNGTGEGLRLGGQKINANFAYLKQYADNLIQGLKWKQRVVAATTANITLSGEQNIDGYTTNASRILVKDQTDKTENGIYVSDAGAWTRATDADTADKLVNATVSVSGGNTQTNTNWTCDAGSIILGSTSINFVAFQGADGVDQGTFDAAIQLINDEIDALEVRVTALENTNYTPPAPYATVAALLADQGNQIEHEEYTVEDASGWSTITSGWATFQKKATSTASEGDYILRETEYTIPKEHQINGIRRDVSTGGTIVNDWASYSLFNYTLTSNTTMTDNSLPTGTNTKVIEMIITGDFTLTLPAYWEAMPNSDTYNGAVRNHLVVTCIKGDPGSEDVLYQLTNLSS